MPRNYKILIPADTYIRAESYLQKLQHGKAKAGVYLNEQLSNVDLHKLDGTGLLRKLCNTKQPQIFAESEVFGNGSDWTLSELQFLGDISIAAEVTIYDDGQHTSPVIHNVPFKGTLVFTSGALLRNDNGSLPADWTEVVSNHQLDFESYYQLYKRRLFSVFEYINQAATIDNPALVTVPGIGCGQFAGEFFGTISTNFQMVLQRLLSDHGKYWSNIHAIYFDPYSDCESSYKNIHDISFITQPFIKSSAYARSQLSHPSTFKVQDKDFSHCQLFSLVAWDPVSWPGNDFYLGYRVTDDGVKAAATDAMKVLTGVEGGYCNLSNKYLPPKNYSNWEEVVIKNNLNLC